MEKNKEDLEEKEQDHIYTARTQEKKYGPLA